VSCLFTPASPADPHWLLVNREDVIPVEENKGLLRIISKEQEGSNFLIEINDVGDCRLSKKRIPKDDLIIF